MDSGTPLRPFHQPQKKKKREKKKKKKKKKNKNRLNASTAEYLPKGSID